MSLDVEKLAMTRTLGGGIIQARCPACAEDGHDHKGEHLRIYPDGRFGCCVHPKDRTHRKRIFALAGDSLPRQFTIKVGRSSRASWPAQSVTQSLAAFVGTLGTAKADSLPSGELPSQTSQPENHSATPSFGRLGRFFLSLARTGEKIWIR
jgi:hypothetical protein